MVTVRCSPACSAVTDRGSLHSTQAPTRLDEYDFLQRALISLDCFTVHVGSRPFPLPCPVRCIRVRCAVRARSRDVEDGRVDIRNAAREGKSWTATATY
eukprot:IDg21169t1